MQRPFLLLLSAALSLSLQAQQITNVTWSPSTPHSCEQVTFTITGTGTFSFNYLNIYTGGGAIELTIQGGGSPSGSFNITPSALGPYPAGSHPLIVNLEQNGTVISTWTGTLNITEVELPDMGEYAMVEVCTTDAPFPLLGQLGGTPDPGGVWTSPLGETVSDGMFVPGTSAEGDYFYTFDFPEPCGIQLQLLTVIYRANNSPGTDTTVSLCPLAGEPEVDLFGLLGGSPDAGGTWSGGNTTGIFVPGVSQPGEYTYHVEGLPPCLGSQATITVLASELSDAGVGDSAVYCFDETMAYLADHISGGVGDGIWYGPNGSGIGYYGEAFDLSTFGEGTYFLVSVTPPCPADTAFVVVTLDGPPCTLGLHDQVVNGSGMRLAPNPAHRQVSVIVEEALEARGLLITDVSGRVVLDQRLDRSGGPFAHTVDVSALSAGSYTCTLILEGPVGRISRQLLVK